MQNDGLDVIILRGAPGSGKSQTAKCLSQRFPMGVRLEVDTIRQMVISVDWRNQKEHIQMLDVAASMTLDFLEHGFHPVMVIDTFSGDKINRFRDTLRRKDSALSMKLFGLYASDDEMKWRLDNRSEAEFRDALISKKLTDDMLRWKRDEEIQIDTTGLVPEQTADLIYKALQT